MKVRHLGVFGLLFLAAIGNRVGLAQSIDDDSIVKEILSEGQQKKLSEKKDVTINFDAIAKMKDRIKSIQITQPSLLTLGKSTVNVKIQFDKGIDQLDIYFPVESVMDKLRLMRLHSLGKKIPQGKGRPVGSAVKASEMIQDKAMVESLLKYLSGLDMKVSGTAPAETSIDSKLVLRKYMAFLPTPSEKLKLPEPVMAEQLPQPQTDSPNSH